MKKTNKMAGIIAALAFMAAVSAQPGRLHFQQLEKLSGKAEEVVDVNLDGAMLQLAGKFLSEKKPGEAEARDLIKGLTGIFVKSFEFSKEGEYGQEDMEAIRSQISLTAWKRVVGVKNKKSKEDVELYLLMEQEKMAGLVIIAAEPKELTVVNLVGSVDLQKLSNLEGNFGIPPMDLESGTQPGKPAKPEEE